MEKNICPCNQSAAASNVESYSGFFEVEKSHLFFWFFPAEKDAKNKPLIVWLQVRLFIFSSDINCLLHINKFLYINHALSIVWPAVLSRLVLKIQNSWKILYFREDLEVPQCMDCSKKMDPIWLKLNIYPLETHT